ncbi:hypothetical protein SUGI_0758020 [Cryptomeria japonica]|nr:hypothetical protein SUGI_0758020 [Cryptomeria japonica]
MPGMCSALRSLGIDEPLKADIRHLLVRQLQCIVELDELVEMIPITSARVQLQSLLALWGNHWPTAEFDDVEAWDDIVQNRLLYIQKSQDLVRKHANNDNSTRLLVADLGSD